MSESIAHENNDDSKSTRIQWTHVISCHVIHYYLWALGEASCEHLNFFYLVRPSQMMLS